MNEPTKVLELLFSPAPDQPQMARVGGGGGALVGHAIDTTGARATGTIMGAAAGALIGRKIDRSRVKCK